MHVSCEKTFPIIFFSLPHCRCTWCITCSFFPSNFGSCVVIRYRCCGHSILFCGCFALALLDFTPLVFVESTPTHRARNKLFTSATEAFRRGGQGAIARDLARRGRELNLMMKEKHRQAAREIFESRNPGDQVKFFLFLTAVIFGLFGLFIFCFVVWPASRQAAHFFCCFLCLT